MHKINVYIVLFFQIVLARVATFFTKSPLEGAQTSIHCAVCEELEVTRKFVVDYIKSRSPMLKPLMMTYLNICGKSVLRWWDCNNCEITGES